jgi:hypothetical protein
MSVASRIMRSERLAPGPQHFRCQDRYLETRLQQIASALSPVFLGRQCSAVEPGWPGKQLARCGPIVGHLPGSRDLRGAVQMGGTLAHFTKLKVA